jgi:DNA-3-methyladenine glycosylase I
MSYCQFVKGEGKESLHRIYHDTAYGFPLHDDNELFGRLVLEINQAGLSWTTILKKEENFRRAYDDFTIIKIAQYGDREVARLLRDAGIIRNRLKVAAAIHNAQVVQSLQNEYGSFKLWLDHHHPKTREEWTKLFKKTFKFTGGRDRERIPDEYRLSVGSS